MKESDLGLYIRRKSGHHMSFRYKISVFLPALLVLLVSFALNFSQIFILSMAEGIEKILIYLGSGSVRVAGHYDGKGEGEVFYVKESGALAFSADDSAPLYLKGVDFDSYFTDERRSLLRLEMEEYDDVLNPVIISRRIAEVLCVSPSSRFTILVYDEDMDRTRPLLVTVAGIYDSGYMEFDSMLSYIPSALLKGSEHSEIILSDSESVDDYVASLSSSGYPATSYKRLYSGIYENVGFSVNVLYGVFIILVILASFFSSNISFYYIDRDKKDIALLFLSGLSLSRIRRVYASMTIRIVFIATAFGLLSAILFSFLTPSILSSLSSHGFAALDAYLTSFEIIIPFARIIAVNAFLLLCSYLTLLIALGCHKREDLVKLFSAE